MFNWLHNGLIEITAAVVTIQGKPGDDSMKKKWFLFFVVLLVVAVSALLWQFHRNPTNVVLTDGTLTSTQAKADAEQLVSIIESTHPEFSLNDIQADYPAAKKSFLAAASQRMSYDDFSWLASAYLASLRDGHTAIQHTQSSETLQGYYRMTENGLFEVDANGNITEKKVIAIGGIPVNQIFQTISRYEVAENEAAVIVNDTSLSTCLPILKRAGVDCTKRTISITEQKGTQTSSKDVAVIQRQSSDSVRQTNDIVDSRRIGDIFYIGLHKCQTGTALDKTIDSLKQAVNSGVTRVIMDVRNNPGGDSTACTELLAAIGMQPPSYGMYARKSSLAVAQHGGMIGGDVTHERSLSTAKTNSNISLAVLTDEFTYSSATMLAVFVQDGKLGTVIGYPSANSPSCYGDVLSFQLKNSGIKGWVSYKRWLRPDANADQRMLHPDILVPIGGDTLQTAIKFLDHQ